MSMREDDVVDKLEQVLMRQIHGATAEVDTDCDDDDDVDDVPVVAQVDCA